MQQYGDLLDGSYGEADEPCKMGFEASLGDLGGTQVEVRSNMVGAHSLACGCPAGPCRFAKMLFVPPGRRTCRGCRTVIQAVDEHLKDERARQRHARHRRMARRPPCRMFSHTFHGVLSNRDMHFMGAIGRS